MVLSFSSMYQLWLTDISTSQVLGEENSNDGPTMDNLKMTIEKCVAFSMIPNLSKNLNFGMIEEEYLSDIADSELEYVHFH